MCFIVNKSTHKFFSIAEILSSKSISQSLFWYFSFIAFPQLIGYFWKIIIIDAFTFFFKRVIDDGGNDIIVWYLNILFNILWWVR